MEETLTRHEIIKRIDDKLKNLIAEGSIPDASDITFCEEFNMKILNKFSSEYWKKVVSFYTEEELSALLSIPQSGNWNRFLYDEAKIRLRNLIDERIECELLS